MHHEKAHICIKPKSFIVIIQEETTAQVIDVRDWTQWDSPEITGIPKCGVDRSVTAEAGIWASKSASSLGVWGQHSVYMFWTVFLSGTGFKGSPLSPPLCSVLWAMLPRAAHLVWTTQDPSYTLSPQPRVFLRDRITKSPWITWVSIFLSSLH